jgi:hypothetical protein
MTGSSFGNEFKVNFNGLSWPHEFGIKDGKKCIIKKGAEASEHAGGHTPAIRVDAHTPITFVMTKSAWKKNAIQIMYREGSGSWNNLSRVDFLSNEPMENEDLLEKIFYSYLSEMGFIN